MPFNSSDLKEFSKNLAGFIAGYSAGYLIGKVVVMVFKNEKNIQGLHSRLIKCENEFVLKK